MNPRLWLVEEHTAEPHGDDERVAWRKVVQHYVEGETSVDLEVEARKVFLIAEQLHRGTCENWTCKLAENHTEYSFAFGQDELVRLQKNYIWGAADGSSIWYEVRYLGTVEMDCAQGKVLIKEEVNDT